MVAVNCKCNGQGEQFGALAKCPQKELPILEPLPAENTYPDTRTKKRHEALKVQMDFSFRGLILLQESPNALIIVLGGINVTHYFLIPLAQHFKFHPWDYIGCTVGVAGSKTAKASLLFQTFVKPCAWGCLK